MSKKKSAVLTNDNDTSIAEIPGRKKILIIDDDPGIGDIFNIILGRAGYDVEIRSDAKAVMENSFAVPHLFLIDKQLQGADGLDICRHLKKQKLTAHIAVIMISASPDIGLLAKEAGADAYMEKPFEITYLLKLLDHYTSQKEEVGFP